MKIFTNLVTFLLLTISSIVTSCAQDGNFKTKDPNYLGEETPGKQPELFASGKVSLEDYFEHSAAIFSPDNKEVYWVAKPNGERNLQIYFMKKVENKWLEMQKTSFSDNNYNFDNPVISADGQKLFFASDMPLISGNERKDWDIWVVKKVGDNWSKPLPISENINTSKSERAPSITNDGSLYFTRIENRNEYIYVSRYINQEYTKPIQLSEGINSGNIDISVFVAHDESYLIIEDIKENNAPSLYISYKLKNNWSELKRLPIGWARFPSVSPDGKYLFFMTREGIYWMNTSFIDELKSN